MQHLSGGREATLRGEDARPHVAAADAEIARSDLVRVLADVGCSVGDVARAYLRLLDDATELNGVLRSCARAMRYAFKDASGSAMKKTMVSTISICFNDERGLRSSADRIATSDTRTDECDAVMNKRLAYTVLDYGKVSSTFGRSHASGVGVSVGGKLVAFMLQFKSCCNLCNKEACSLSRGLLTCTRCYSVVYCSPSCSAADWPEHKEFCKYVQGVVERAVPLILTPPATS